MPTLLSRVHILNISLHIFSTLGFTIHLDYAFFVKVCTSYNGGTLIAYHKMLPKDELPQHSPFIHNHSNPSQDTNISHVEYILASL